jgi:hypothetical protein
VHLDVDRLEAAVVRELGRARRDADDEIHLGSQQQMVAGA